MKGHKSSMQVISSIYFLIVAIGLFLWIHFFSADILVKNMIPVTLGLIVLWFLFIYIVMRQQGKGRNNREDEK